MPAFMENEIYTHFKHLPLVYGHIWYLFVLVDFSTCNVTFSMSSCVHTVVSIGAFHLVQFFTLQKMATTESLVQYDLLCKSHIY